MMFRKDLKKKILPAFIFTGLLLNGCSNSDSSSSSNTLNVDVNSAVTASMSENNSSILEAEVSVAGSQSSNAALFMLGADAAEILATITGINFPSISGVTFTQIIPNGSSIRDCTVGLTFSNDNPNCILKVSIAGSAGTEIDDDIEIVTDVQTLSINVQTEIVNEGSTSLPQGQINTTPTVAPDTTVQVIVTNPGTNSQSFNTLTLTIPAWLYNLASNFQGGTVSTNSDGSKTITYTVNGLNQNLTPGSSHTFSFDLDGESTTTDTLLEYYAELISNSTTGVLTVNAANLRNPMKPSLTVSLTPATITESVTLSDPGITQTVTFSNISNAQLQITSIDTSNLPTGVSVNSTTCSTTDGNYIEPADDVGDSCNIVLAVTQSAVPASNKTLTVNYKDIPAENIFSDETTVTIGGASITVDLTSIELPVRGDETNNVAITNDGALNWTPSSNTDNYQISVSGQSVAASNIEVTSPNGEVVSCLGGAAVEPAESCYIGIAVNGDTEGANYTQPGDYVLSLFAANNLTSTSTTNFTVVEPTFGAFQFLSGASVITTQSVDIDASEPVTVTVFNAGNVTIANFSLDIPNYFTQSNNTCEDINELAGRTACTVGLSIAAGAGIGEGSYAVTAIGSEETVEGNVSLTLEPQGAVVSIGSIDSIRQPNSGNNIGTVTITNGDSLAWSPSDNSDDYDIAVLSGDGEEVPEVVGINIVDPGSANPYCLDGAVVAVNESCDIGIEVSSDASVDSYTLTLALANNLATTQTQSFDVIGSLGFFSFSLSSIDLGSGSTDQPQTIMLTNDGNTPITNVYIDTLGIPEGFSVSNGCGDSETLLAELGIDESCSFTVAAANTIAQDTEIRVSAIGASGVENSGLEFVTTISGVAVEIQQINGGDDIPRTAAGTDVYNVEISNLGNEAWTPPILVAKYQLLNVADRENPVVVADGENPSIVAPTPGDGVDNCRIGGDFSVGVTESCYVGIQVGTSTDTDTGNYTLQVLSQTGETYNLPQSSNTQSFSIINSLGYLTYSGDGVEADAITLTAGGDTSTITLSNIGETNITNLSLSSGQLTLTYPDEGGCDDLTDSTLPQMQSCTFNLSAAGNTAVGDHIFTASGTDTSNSPNLTVTVLPGRYEIYTAEGDTCILDSDTGLIWARQGNLTANVNWATADADPAGQNAASLCGFSNWRLPTIAEFQNLTNDNTTDPTPRIYLQNNNFTYIQNSQYWSSDETSETTANAFNMRDGGTNDNNKTAEKFVLPVRSEPVESSCSDDADPQCRVFVTDSTYNGNLGGIAGANDTCEAYAINTLGIAEAEAANFRAWLSTSAINASGNILYNPRIEYVLASDTNTTVAAEGALVSGNLQNAISGSANTVWTGTKADGSIAAPIANCESWSEFGNVGYTGTSNVTDPSWTYSGAIGGCTAQSNALYCFEAPVSDSECSGDNPTCRVFVTESDYDGNLGGLAGADAKCQADANNPGGGVFKAWLSAAGPINAVNRIGYFNVDDDESNIIYKNLDGDRIVDPNELLTGPFLTRITEDNGLAWTATGSDGEFEGPNSCSTWSVDAGTDTIVGNPAAEIPVNPLDPDNPPPYTEWTDLPPSQTCDNSYHLICFEVPQEE